MSDGYKFAMERTRQGVIAAAGIKLARSLTDNERVSIEWVDSLLRLESYARRFAATEYPPTQVLADLDFLTKQLKQK